MSTIRLAPVAGRALDGKVFELPQDLPAIRTLVVLAFRQHQQACVDRWLDAAIAVGAAPTPLGAATPLTAAAVELPVLGRRYLPARRLIDGGMATGIGDPAVLARTITVYTDPAALRRRCGLPPGDTVEALVATRDGDVVFHASGEPDTANTAGLAAALTP